MSISLTYVEMDVNYLTEGENYLPSVYKLLEHFPVVFATLI